VSHAGRVVALHPAVEAEIRRLGRLGLPAAEVRRRIRSVAETTGAPLPGYTVVLELVRDEAPFLHATDEPGIAGALLGGRAPTLYEAANTVARARVHKERIALERAPADEGRRARAG
jgi:hypothetical protein